MRIVVYEAQHKKRIERNARKAGIDLGRMAALRNLGLVEADFEKVTQ